MLSAHCPRHDATVLVPTAQIHAIDNTERAMVVRWRCTCGHQGRTSFPRRQLV